MESMTLGYSLLVGHYNFFHCSLSSKQTFLLVVSFNSIFFYIKEHDLDHLIVDKTNSMALNYIIFNMFYYF